MKTIWKVVLTIVGIAVGLLGAWFIIHPLVTNTLQKTLLKSDIQAFQCAGAVFCIIGLLICIYAYNKKLRNFVSNLKP